MNKKFITMSALSLVAASATGVSAAEPARHSNTATQHNVPATQTREGIYVTGEAALATMASKGYNVSAMQAQYSNLKDQFMKLPTPTAVRLMDSMALGFKAGAGPQDSSQFHTPQQKDAQGAYDLFAKLAWEMNHNSTKVNNMGQSDKQRHIPAQQAATGTQAATLTPATTVPASTGTQAATLTPATTVPASTGTQAATLTPATTVPAATGTTSTGTASTGTASTGTASTGTAVTGKASTGKASTGTASTGTAATPTAAGTVSTGTTATPTAAGTSSMTNESANGSVLNGEMASSQSTVRGVSKTNNFALSLVTTLSLFAASALSTLKLTKRK